jgi:hypothetical protein
MKKTLNARKLRVTTETVRSLTHTELSAAAGGSDTLVTELGWCQPSVPRPCHPHTPACPQ